MKKLVDWYIKACENDWYWRVVSALETVPAALMCPLARLTLSRLTAVVRDILDSPRRRRVGTRQILATDTVDGLCSIACRCSVGDLKASFQTMT